MGGVTPTDTPPYWESFNDIKHLRRARTRAGAREIVARSVKSHGNR